MVNPTAREVQGLQEQVGKDRFLHNLSKTGQDAFDLASGVAQRGWDSAKDVASGVSNAFTKVISCSTLATIRRCSARGGTGIGTDRSLGCDMFT